MFEIINDTNYKIENLDTLNNYLNFLVKKRNLEDAIFNIIFVTSEKIHEINKEYRKHCTNYTHNTGDVNRYRQHNFQSLCLH